MTDPDDVDGRVQELRLTRKGRLVLASQAQVNIIDPRNVDARYCLQSYFEDRALVEAKRLYQRAGFVEVEPFNNEPYAHHWFQKDLRQE